MTQQISYKRTLRACYFGYVSQAIVNNFAPLLFVQFQSEFSIPLTQITLLITVNFGAQLMIDWLSSYFVDRIGYKAAVIIAHILLVCGLLGLGFLPGLFEAPFVGMILSVILYGMGGGLLEVLLSPIVEACKTGKNNVALSTLYSFYSFGFMSVILLSTLFFTTVGVNKWRVLAALWALIPLGNALNFAFSPMPKDLGHNSETKIPKNKLVRMSVFWIFILLIFSAGASQEALLQWVSFFAESGLKVSKTIGDLAGPCLIALLLGLNRLFYIHFNEKINLYKYLLFSAILCTISYIAIILSSSPIIGLIACALCGLSCGMLWPGTYSLVTEKYPGAGTAMFSFLALSGDLGCGTGPTVLGMVSSLTGSLQSGFSAALIFPLLTVLGLILLGRKTHVKGSGEPLVDPTGSSASPMPIAPVGPQA